MATIVYKKYKRERMHTKNVKRDNNKEIVTASFCDTKKATAEEVILKRDVEFNDFKIGKDIEFNFCSMSIGNITENPVYEESLTEGKKINKQKVSISNEKLSLEDYALIYNNFDFNDGYRVYFNKRYCDDYNEFMTSNYRNSNVNDILIFRLKELNINEEEGLVSGKIEIVLMYYKCSECNEYFIYGHNEKEENKLQGLYIYDDEEHYKLTIMRNHAYTTKGLVWQRHYKDMYIYKKATGMLYKITDFAYSGSEYLKKKFPKKIVNITYSPEAKAFEGVYGDEDLVREAKKDFRTLVENEMATTYEDVYEHTIKDIENIDGIYEDEKYRLLYIKKKLNIKSTLLAQFLSDAKRMDSLIFTRIKGLSEADIMKYFKLNTKRLSKIIENRTTREYATLYYLIDDANNLNDIAEGSADLRMIQRVPNKRNFLYQYRKNNTEKRFLNQYLKDYRIFLYDACNMYAKIKEKVKDYPVDFSKEIKELHDIFAKDINRLKEENVKIKQNKKLKELFKDVEINNIRYSLAKDTDELIKTGTIMNICVGGYREAALEQKSYIVIGYNKEEIPVTCIEFKKESNNFVVTQVKKRNNYAAKNSEVDKLRELFNSNNIIISSNDLDINRRYKLKEEDTEVIISMKNNIAV